MTSDPLVVLETTNLEDAASQQLGLVPMASVSLKYAEENEVNRAVLVHKSESMASENRPLRVFFFPFLAHGHMIPMLDIAKLFASHGVHSTVITTPVNSIRISKSIASSGLNIDVKTIPFQAAEVGLPEGYETIDMVLSSPDHFFMFVQAIDLLQQPLGKLLEAERPDCLVSDLFLAWSVGLAQKLNIRSIVFHGMGFFPMCAMDSLRLHKPYKSVNSDAELFCIPNLPDEIRITRTQIEMETEEDDGSGFGYMLEIAKAAELKSDGMIVNSFFDLEPSYVDYYKNTINKKVWCVGPLSLCNRNAAEKGVRGNESAIEDHQCLKWLDDKTPDSVMYVCFGSGCTFADAQLRDIASGLELSGKIFIWVIGRSPNSGSEDYLPVGFEERVKDRGLLIRGWAPQVLILDHPSVGGFVTHCGWNSLLEGITAGLPMVTWPLYSEQFLNEKLVTDVLQIGVGVGVKKWSWNGGDHMDKETVEKAVRIIMEGEEAKERRGRARQLGKMAKSATEKDGSSYIDLLSLLDDLKSMRET